MPNEIWTETTALRYTRRMISIGAHQEYAGYIFILQKLWRSDVGKEEWRDVPVIDEQTQAELPAHSLYFGESH